MSRRERRTPARDEPEVKLSRAWEPWEDDFGLKLELDVPFEQFRYMPEGVAGRTVTVPLGGVQAHSEGASTDYQLQLRPSQSVFAKSLLRNACPSPSPDFASVHPKTQENSKVRVDRKGSRLG